MIGRVSSTHIGKSYVTPKRSRPSDCYSASLNIYQAEQTEHGIFQFSCGQRLVLLSYLFGYDSAMYRGGGVYCASMCASLTDFPQREFYLYLLCLITCWIYCCLLSGKPNVWEPGHFLLVCWPGRVQETRQTQNSSGSVSNAAHHTGTIEAHAKMGGVTQSTHMALMLTNQPAAVRRMTGSCSVLFECTIHRVYGCGHCHDAFMTVGLAVQD